MTCPEHFEVNPLYQAANGTGERATVKQKDLQTVIDCCLTSDPMDRQLEYRLAFKGGTVNREALFELLTKHARSHRPQQMGGFKQGGTVTGRMSGSGHIEVATPRPLKDAALDGLAKAMKDYLCVDAEARFKLLCQENGIDPAKYAGRNFGLQRMALGNELRNRLKKGETVTVCRTKVLK